MSKEEKKTKVVAKAVAKLPKIEMEIANPYCSKCGELATKCDFPAEIKSASVLIEDKMMIIDVNQASTALARMTQVKIFCSNGHSWDRDYPSKHRTSGL
jgi:hypothetical protein